MSSVTLDRPERSLEAVGWTAASTGTSLLCTFAFACVTPLAGLAALLALRLPRAKALGVVGATWLANQAVGFAFLDYPFDRDCLAWGAAMGAATMAATMAAGQSRRIAHPAGRAAAAFLAAFATYQVLLFALTPILGGAETFAADIVSRVFAINAVTFLALIALSAALASSGWRTRTVALLPARS